jgi:hypothetical protein
MATNGRRARFKQPTRYAVWRFAQVLVSIGFFCFCDNLIRLNHKDLELLIM